MGTLQAGCSPHIAMKRSQSKYSLLWSVVTVIPFLYLVFIVTTSCVDVPFWDQWQLIPLFKKSHQGALSFHDFWVQYGSHRLFFPKLIMVALAHLTNWNTCYELAVNVFLAVGIFVAVAVQVRRTQNTLGMDRHWWILAPISLFVFSLNQIECWLWGFQIQILLNVCPIIIAAVLLSKPAFNWTRFWVAAALTVIGSYSYANGLGFWVLGLGILYFSHRQEDRPPKVAFILWTSVAALVIGSYLWGFESSDVSFNAIMKRPLQYLNTFQRIWGLPWSPSVTGWMTYP